MKKITAPVSSKEILMAVSALLLAIVASVLGACASTPKSVNAPTSPVAETSTMKLPERRVVTWSVSYDLVTGDITRTRACRWEPSGAPCKPDSY